MSKLFFQGALSLALFFGTWYLFSQIDYTGRFNLGLGEEQERKRREPTSAPPHLRIIFPLIVQKPPTKPKT